MSSSECLDNRTSAADQPYELQSGGWSRGELRRNGAAAEPAEFQAIQS